MLHILQSAIDQTDFEQLLTTVEAGDALVLMDDGVYLLEQLHQAPCPGYVIQGHRQMRGLMATQGIVELDMEGLVTLTAQHTSSASW
ncbi:MAG: DsrH/TusB family sulfur metabolism protein [Gammaproteobacteria bacterium]|jgi:sulfur relay protein TusB/DsrH|nr:DsrH/TusB family sulfur metabolism protein [Gammaproteobacteria bacterium]